MRRSVERRIGQTHVERVARVAGEEKLSQGKVRVLDKTTRNTRTGSYGKRSHQKLLKRRLEERVVRLLLDVLRGLHPDRFVVVRDRPLLDVFVLRLHHRLRGLFLERLALRLGFDFFLVVRLHRLRGFLRVLHLFRDALRREDFNRERDELAVRLNEGRDLRVGRELLRAVFQVQRDLRSARQRSLRVGSVGFARGGAV
eukprot:29675-Pelagococcus_subviridis.AAC.4